MKVRLTLLLIGLLLLGFQFFVFSFSVTTQFIFFLTGILLLGVPHGAADLLVATQHATDEKKSFSTFYFLVNYLARLLVFGAILWFFPLIGNFMFIFFAAYHFGETDLYKFDTKTFVGKIFVISYGMLILSVILINHFEEVKPIFQMFKAGETHINLINWIDTHRQLIMISCLAFFLFCTVIYFSKKSNAFNQDFLIQLIPILFILYKLPMVLGFTFYFIVWHSIISLNNIVNYLRKDGMFSFVHIAKQIGFYSVLAIVGIVLFGFTGLMWINNNATMGYVFLGLAVLTAPHMQVMHEMYCSIRASSILKQK
jgi:beta-carotene 15,15'-dioxygenase